MDPENEDDDFKEIKNLTYAVIGIVALVLSVCYILRHVFMTMQITEI